MQSDPVNGTVAYLGDTELLVPAGSTVVSGQRTYTVLGHAVAVRTATTGVTGSVMTWLDTDPQGTAEISENPTTGATTTRLFDAFGNPRGTPVTWASNDGFLNQPTDSLTGLDDLGARVYRPTLGRFLSEDSVFDASDPQQDDGYSYSRNNPATAADPSGLHAVDDNGETDPYWAAVQRQNVQHGCSDCGSNGGDNYTGGDTGGYYGGYASPSDVPPDQASSTAVQHAATPNPVFQPNALSKAGGGLAIINARINKLMRLSNTVDAAVTAINNDPDYNQQIQEMDAVLNPPPPAPVHHHHCGFFCSMGHVASSVGHAVSRAADDVGSALGAAAKWTYNHIDTIASALTVCSAVPGVDFVCGPLALAATGIALYKNGSKCIGGSGSGCLAAGTDLLGVGATSAGDWSPGESFHGPFGISARTWGHMGRAAIGGFMFGSGGWEGWP